MIGVHVGGHDSGKLKDVMEREKLGWRSFADQGDIAARWSLAGTPTLYVLDHRGVIRHKWVGSPGEKAIDAALSRLIDEAEGGGKDAAK